jgi:DNA polymerase III subunit gamma/tau
VLLNEVETDLRLVRYSPGRIEFEPASGARSDLASRLGQRLQGWTGARWAVSVTSTGGAPTIAEARRSDLDRARSEVAGNPLVSAILAAFPGATIGEVRSPEAMLAVAAETALPAAEADTDETWDPFEE